MEKHTIIIALGLLTAFVPFLGLPSSWKAALFVAFGFGIASTGFLLRRDAHAPGGAKQHRPDTYVENGMADATPDNTTGNEGEEATREQ